MSDVDRLRRRLQGTLTLLKHNTEAVIVALENPREPLPDDEHSGSCRELVDQSVAALRLAERLSVLVYGVESGVVDTTGDSE